MGYDPFAADSEPTRPEPVKAPAETKTTTGGPTMDKSESGNWVSFGFASEPGYGKIMATVHGSPEFVAESFGIEDFDGRISTLMKRAILVDSVFKKWYAGDSGKA